VESWISTEGRHKIKVGSMHAATQSRDITLRQAALIAGFGLLIMGVLAPLYALLAPVNRPVSLLTA
jgi:hypothetical protein